MTDETEPESKSDKFFAEKGKAPPDWPNEGQAPLNWSEDAVDAPLRDVLNALIRVADDLERQSKKLMSQLDYSAEFPGEDARMLRIAHTMLTDLLVKPKAKASRTVRENNLFVCGVQAFHGGMPLTASRLSLAPHSTEEDRFQWECGWLDARLRTWEPHK